MTITRTREEIAKLLTATDEPVVIELTDSELGEAFVERKMENYRLDIDYFAEENDYVIEDEEWDELIDYLISHEDDFTSLNCLLGKAFEYCDIKQKKKYTVRIKFTGYATMEIEATSEDEAQELYEDDHGGEYDEYEIDWDDWEVDSVEEV